MPNRLLPAGALSIITPIGAIYLTMAFLVVGTTVEIFIPYFMQILHGASPLTGVMLTGSMIASSDQNTPAAMK